MSGLRRRALRDLLPRGAGQSDGDPQEKSRCRQAQGRDDEERAHRHHQAKPQQDRAGKSNKKDALPRLGRQGLTGKRDDHCVIGAEKQIEHSKFDRRTQGGQDDAEVHLDSP